MSIRAAISRVSLWLPAIVIAFAVISNSGMPPLNTTPSSVGAAVLSGFVFVISGLSASACWDAIRYRHAAEIMLDSRGVARLIVWLLVPLLGWAVVAFVVFWGLTYTQVGTWVTPHPATYFLAAILWFAWSIFGIAMAWSLPRLIALVVAAVIPFTVTSFAWAVSDFAWRHMFGVPSSCCRLGGEIHQNMIMASTMTLFAVVIVPISILMFSRRRVIVSAVLFLIATLVIGLSHNLATGVENYSAAQPRNPQDAVCDGDFCYWPESTQDQIDANRLALEWVRATLPQQWLTPDGGVEANRAIYVGNDIENHIPFGSHGEPLSFEPTSNPDEVYHRHLIAVLYREGGDFRKAATIPVSSWARWRDERLGQENATPEQVYAAVEALDQEFYGVGTELPTN